MPLLRLEIVKRSDDTKGFVVLPRRWVVERTFSWFARNRRLTKDFENLPKPWAPSLPSPPSSLASGGLPGVVAAISPDQFEPREAPAFLMRTSPAPSRSWIAAEWITTRIGSPSLSTRAWILRPFTCLPAS